MLAAMDRATRDRAGGLLLIGAFVAAVGAVLTIIAVVNEDAPHALIGALVVLVSLILTVASFRSVVSGRRG
jgi:hypothetical protein